MDQHAEKPAWEPSATAPQPAPRRGWLYLAMTAALAVLIFLLLALLLNINQRKQEAQQHFFQVVELDENSIDPAIWGRNFPRQYDSYRRTVDTERTRYGGSDAFSRLDADPRLKRLFAGYAFGIEYREERGHAYMLRDQEMTQRVKQLPQPGACLHCHASVLPAYRQEGQGDILKGFAKVCAMPWEAARPLVSHPVTCIDCHDPKTLQLRVTRPAFLAGIQALAQSDDAVPHLPSIGRWRQGDRQEGYDPNALASRQEMRSFVCAQCHVEYYFQKETKLLTYPWSQGLKVEQIERYYDGLAFHDWNHAESGAPVLKAQHPEFELWSQGIHARSGVSCADCHMPYQREGAVKISDHHVRSPLLSLSRACQTCHRYPESEILARAEAIQTRTKGLLDRAEAAVVDLIDAIRQARDQGATDEQLAAARQRQRQAQWRVDFVAAENSLGFHAPQESARILAEAIDLARQGQIALLHSRK